MSPCSAGSSESAAGVRATSPDGRSPGYHVAAIILVTRNPGEYMRHGLALDKQDALVAGADLGGLAIITIVNGLRPMALRRQFSLGLLVLGVASLGGSMIALRYVLSAVLSPIIGKMSDQSLGRSTVIIVGITAGTISFLIFGFAGSLGYILVGIVFNALSGSALSVALAATLGDFVVQQALRDLQAHFDRE